MDRFDFIGISAEALEFLRRVPGDLAMRTALDCGDPDKLAARLIRNGDMPDDARALAAEVRRIQEDVKHFPGIALGHILSESATEMLSPLESIALNATDLSPSPRWTSTIPKLDDRTSGGFYGLTALGGNAGVGKSLLAIAVAVEFARAGGKAICFNAEMTTKQMLSRVWYASNGRSGDLVGKSLRLHHVNHTITVRDLVRECADDLEFVDERLLVVIDSINTIADMASARSGAEYFSVLAELVGWCATVRRRSEGAISLLLVSELNARGEVKGLKLEYVADLVVRLTKAETPEFVGVEVSKGREGGRGELGTFFVDWRAGRLKGAE